MIDFCCFCDENHDRFEPREEPKNRIAPDDCRQGKVDSREICCATCDDAEKRDMCGQCKLEFNMGHGPYPCWSPKKTVAPDNDSTVERIVMAAAKAMKLDRS